MKRRFPLVLSLLLVLPILADKDRDPASTDALRMLSGGADGISEFNHWHEQHPEIRVSLQRTNLKGADLREANLFEVDLTESDLTGAKLWRTYFYRANLTGANLSEVSFAGANFRGVTYVGATMSRELLLEIERQNRETVVLAK